MSPGIPFYYFKNKDEVLRPDGTACQTRYHEFAARGAFGGAAAIREAALDLSIRPHDLQLDRPLESAFGRNAPHSFKMAFLDS